ncbi:Cof-type HAD-IIB family hydrolase [Halalkalibacter urbisdiaboli]|uniref:Cof-type HAD-IIB family hydrolase n=1 Tax=Halalkalibacter urbisdiaboli TaxID=1960589 RepID=UPI000B42DC64|nr:Cof-type HAD-IIB family hydrolase [Halalkalibacter urbisdiaboli]
MKLITTDMDGTLLNERSEVSPESIKAIRKAQELGIEVVIATGRSYKAASKPLIEAGLSCPIICLNGAQIYLEDGELIRNIALDKEACRKIELACTSESSYFEIFTSAGGYSINRDAFIHILVDVMKAHYPDVATDVIIEKVKQRFQDEKIQTVNDFDHIFNNDDIDVFKFLTFSLEDDALKRIREQLKGEHDLSITSSGHQNLEFNHRDANKGAALAFYSSRQGIELEDVMAIGDNFNDYSMLEVAGLSVAMENAAPGIKEICDFTTKKNSEHGVAIAIEEVLKGGIRKTVR